MQLSLYIPYAYNHVFSSDFILLYKRILLQTSVYAPSTFMHPYIHNTEKQILQRENIIILGMILFYSYISIVIVIDNFTVYTPLFHINKYNISRYFKNVISSLT